MNKDIFVYKKRFTVFILLFSYTYLYFKLTGNVSDISFQNLIDFDAPLPFNQRVLIPLIAKFIASLTVLKLDKVFFIVDFIFINLTFWILLKLFKEEFESKGSELLVNLFILLLPLVTIINYRYTHGGKAAVFFPYDMATLFFMSLGFYCCLKERWFYFGVTLILATLNRESSFLLILLIPALHLENLKKNTKPFILAITIYCITRFLILHFLPLSSGGVVEFYIRLSRQTHFEMNMLWLFKEENIFLLIYSMAALPLFWFYFFDYIPERYRPVRYIALLYFLMLLFVGNLMEGRIFIEIIVLLYFPLCIAIKHWLLDTKILLGPITTAAILNRYAILASLFFVFSLWELINKGLIVFAPAH